MIICVGENEISNYLTSALGYTRESIDGRFELEEEKEKKNIIKTNLL